MSLPSRLLLSLLTCLLSVASVHPEAAFAAEKPSEPAPAQADAKSATPAVEEPTFPERELSDTEMLGMLKLLDDRQANSGDYKSMALIKQVEQGKDDLLYQAVIYRRDADDKLMILFLAPKTEAGKGYLRIEKNLWFYDSQTGKWERRTERERIGGTDSNRQDFDESRLAEEYTSAYVGLEKLGNFQVHHLKLSSKPGLDVAYPTLEIWVDTKTSNILKRQEFALSGRLMRTTFYPQWERVWSNSKGGMVYYPKRILIFDEVVKGNKTEVQMQEIDLNALDESLFTKAWLEGKSR